MTDLVIGSASHPGILSKYLGMVSERFDPLMPHSHILAHVDATTVDRVRTDVTSTFSAGNTQTLRLPTGFYISEVYLEVALGAPGAGTYADYVGLLMPRRMIVRQSDTLQEIDYRPMMQWVLSNMTDERKSLLLTNVGGTTPGAGTYIIPIPVFFSHLIAGNDDAPSIPSFALASPIEIEITWNAAADTLAAGGALGATFVSSMTMVTVVKKSTDSLRMTHERIVRDGKWQFPYIDFQTKMGMDVPTATETTINIDEFDGTLSFLQIQPHLKTDVTTAHNPYILKALDSFRLVIEGSEFDRRLRHIESSFESLFTGFRPGKCAIAGLGSTDPFTISFGGQKVEEAHAYTGALNTDAINSLQFVLTHTLGADARIEIIAGRYAIWSIDGSGYLHRSK